MHHFLNKQLSCKYFTSMVVLINEKAFKALEKEDSGEARQILELLRNPLLRASVKQDISLVRTASQQHMSDVPGKTIMLRDCARRALEAHDVGSFELAFVLLRTLSSDAGLLTVLSTIVERARDIVVKDILNGDYRSAKTLLHSVEGLLLADFTVAQRGCFDTVRETHELQDWLPTIKVAENASRPLGKVMLNYAERNIRFHISSAADAVELIKSWKYAHMAMTLYTRIEEIESISSNI